MLSINDGASQSTTSAHDNTIVVPNHDAFYKDHMRRCKQCQCYPDQMCSIGRTLKTIIDRGK